MSTKFTKEMVDDYADKLLIGLTSEENQMVLDEFEIIDETINTINEIEGIFKKVLVDKNDELKPIREKIIKEDFYLPLNGIGHNIVEYLKRELNLT